MSENSLAFRQETLRAGDNDLVLERAGSGPPLLVLHEELGCPGVCSWQVELAKSRTLLQLHHPGFGRSERVDWVEGMRDLACLYAWALRDNGLAPVDVVGFSFGGWVAAEMAANDPSLFSRMVLVGAPGIQPEQGEICDMFMLTADAYLRRSVIDPQATAEFAKLYGAEQTPEQYEAFEEARAETARLAWKPYMFSRTLPKLLEAVSTPSLLVWGDEDRIVPKSVGEAYRAALAGSKLAVLPGAGHRPEIEQRDAFLKEIQNFLG